MHLFMSLGPIIEKVLKGEISNGVTLMESVREHGVSGIEINLGITSKLQFTDLGLNKFRGQVSFHSDHREFNLASMNKYIREASILQLVDEIKLADKLEVTHLTFHPGRESKYLIRSQSMKTFWSSLQIVFDHVGVFQTTLCLENMDSTPNKLCRTMKEVSETLDRFPSLNLTCDFAHLAQNNINSGTFIDRFTDRIKHIHASGVVSGKSHGNTSLKESMVNMMPTLLRFADQDITIVIENNTSEILQESLSMFTSSKPL